MFEIGTPLPADEQLGFLQAFFESAEIGICVTDRDRRFVMVNPAYCRVYGYQPEELIGEPFTRMLPRELHDRAGALHDEFLAGGNESAGEWEVIKKSGERRRVLVTAGRVVLADGRRYKVTTVLDVSDIRQTEHELHRLSEVVARTSHGVIFTDTEGRVTWVNEATVRMTGYTLEELRGRKPGNLLQGPDSDPAVVAYIARQLAAGEGFQVEIVNYTKTGQKYDLHISCSPVRDSAGVLDGFMALQTDITERKTAEQRMQRASFEARKLNFAVDQSPASIVITNCDGNIEYANRTCLDNSGYTRRELIGQHSRIFQSGRTPKAVYAELWATISAGHAWQGRLVNRRKDGVEYVEWASISPVFDGDGEPVCFIAVKEDITEREQLAERMRSLERYDPLTGLANRAAFFQVLEQRLAQVIPPYSRQPLALVNIDRFHAFNEAHGHDTADRLLQMVAQRLTEQASHGTLVARLGPDEFAVLPPLEDLSGGELSQRRELQWVQRIQRALRESFVIDSRTLMASASIGVAFFDQEHIASKPFRPGEFMQMTDSALRAAKSQGGGKIGFFDAEASLQAQEAFRLEQDLAQVIERAQLRLAIQAQVGTDGQLVGAEVLLRWRHDILGDISPGRFIPLAEDNGQIIAIGYWVLERALSVLQRLQAIDPALTLSVNVSPVQIRHKSFVDGVEALLAAAAAQPAGLILEITESVFMTNPELAQERLRALRALGIGIAIDDFGTGYSSLSYLKRLPVTELKIDQSFVSGLPQDKADFALVKIIISAARQLNLRVVAEGVETLEQAGCFTGIPGIHMQGYLYGKPTDIDEWFAEWGKLATGS